MKNYYSKLLLLLGTFAIGSSVWGQVTIPAANTNSGSVNDPLGTYFGFERTAMIYTPAQIGTSGSINAVGFYVNSVSTPGNSVNVRIYMKERTTTFTATSTYATETTGATLVYGPTTINSSSFVAGSWTNITLATPFNYTGGTNNLEVIVETNATGTGNEGSTAKQFRYNTQASNQFYQRWNADNTAPTGNGSLSTFRPNIQLTFAGGCNIPSATVSPTSSTAADVSWTCTSCTGTYILEYGAAGFTPGTGATAGTGGTIISPATSPTSLTGLSATATTDVYVRQDCGGTYSSNSVVAKFIPGDVCANAIDLGALTSPISSTTIGANHDVSYACNANTDPDLIYYIDVPVNYTLVIGQTVNGYDSENYLHYGGACPGTTQVACFDDADIQNITWQNTTGSTQRLYWVQDGFNSGNSGTFTLAWTLTAPPACVAPTSLGASNFSGGSADLTWTCSGCTGSYQIEYGAQGFTQGTGTTVTSASSPRNITGLTVGSQYSFYVRQDCGGGSFSTWTGPFNFRVPAPGDVCGAPIVISSLPYSTTDNTSNYGDDYDVADRPALTGAQVANGTGTADYLTGDDVVYSFTPATTGCYNINLTNPSDWISLFLFQGCAPFTSTVGYHTATSGTTRSLPNLNLTAGQTYYIVLSSWPAPQNFAYTLTVEACPTCPQPTVLGSNTVLSTTANFTWTSNASSSLFDIYYGTTPLTAPTGATTPTVDDYNGGAGASVTYGATALTPNTSYQYYVREDCGGGDVSTWSGPHSFTTPPPPPANDNCAGAIAFPSIPTTGACANLTLNTAGATQSLAACAGSGADDDVWFSFVVPMGFTSVNFSNTTVSGNTDRVIQFFDACGGTSLLCSDPETGTVTGLTPGNTYYGRIHTYSSGTSTNVTVCLSVPPLPPANDNCTNAKPLPICGAPDTTRNLGGATQSLAAISCGGFTGTADDDVWYSFVAPSSDLVITLFSTYDGVLELRSGACNGTNVDCGDINVSNQFEDILATGLTPGATYYIRVYSYGSTKPTSSDFIVLTVAEPGCWLGTNSSDWNTAGNWSDFVVPNSCASNVTIPAGTPFAPSITSATFTVGNVNIASGVNLTLTGNNLNVCGNWVAGTGANAVTVGTGNVVLQGTAAQTISGNTNFERLTVNATGSYTNNGTVSISQRYTPQAGSLNNAGTMTFLSTSPTDIATIDLNPTNAGSLTGNITAQRFIPAGGSNQHYVSSPLNSLPLSQFGASGGSGFVVPTATCDETQLASGSPYGTVFRYNEANGSSCSLAGWEVVSSGSAENARGYSAYLTGAGAPLSVNGVANMSSTYTKAGNTRSGWSNTTLQGRTQNSGWALVGNPYLSTINLGDKTAAGFDNQAQVWQTSGPYTGTYQPVVMGSGSAFVAPFQGFMVRKSVDGGTADFTVGRTECVNNTSTFYKTSSNGTVSIVVNGNGFADVTKVVFDENATNQFDNTLDANKLPGRLAQPMLASKIGSELYSINNLNSIVSNPSVPLEFMPGTNGDFTFTFDDLSTFDPTVMVYLEDKLSTSSWYDLRSRNTQTFTCKTTDLKDRFVLHFTAPIQTDAVDASCDNLGEISIENPSQTKWTVDIANSQGVSVSNQLITKGNVSLSNLTPGTYDITFTSPSGYVATRQITISGVQPLVANFTASTFTPNVNQAVQFNSSVSSPSTVNWEFGDGNTSTIENPTHVYANEGIYEVVFTAVSNDGCKETTTQNVNVRSAATGIGNNNNIKEVIVNSIGNQVVVSFNGYTNENASISISNVLGQVLFTGNHNVANTFNYTLKDVDTQVLIIKTTIDGKSITNKLALTSK